MTRMSWTRQEIIDRIAELKELEPDEYIDSALDFWQMILSIFSYKSLKRMFIHIFQGDDGSRIILFDDNKNHISTMKTKELLLSEAIAI